MRGGASPVLMHARPARSRAGRTVWPQLALALLLAVPGLALPGCQRTPGEPAVTAGGFRPIAKPKPAVAMPPLAATRATTATAPLQPQLAADDVARPGNPAAWGESAQIAVGRQFEPIFFDADSDELDVNGRQRLREYATWLTVHPQVWVTLAGHTDQLGSTRYSYTLGMARALAVQDFLIGQGLAPGRLYAISFGRDLPAAEGKPAETKALDNRVELLAFIAPLGVPAPAPIPLEKRPAPGEQQKSPAAGRMKELQK